MRMEARDLPAATRVSTTTASMAQHTIIFSKATTAELRLPTSIAPKLCSTTLKQQYPVMLEREKQGHNSEE